MKRPLCVIGFTMFASLFVFCMADSVMLPLIAGGLCVILACAALVLKGKKKKHLLFAVTLLFSISASAILFLGAESLYSHPALLEIGQKKEVQAEITDYPGFDDSRVHVMAKLANKHGLFGAKIRLSFSKSTRFDGGELYEKLEKLKPGDKVSFTGNVYKIASSYKSANQNYKSRKVFIAAYPTSKVNFTFCERIKPQYLLKHERQRVINQLFSAFDTDDAALAISVLLGDKSFLDDEIYNNFRAAGVAHIMAVSGLHLSIWIMFLLSISSFFEADKRKLSLALLAFVFLVMSFAMFSASVMRAGVMMFVYLFGFVLRRKSDALNSLGFACMILLIINPYIIMSVGFLLSVTACLAVICAAGPLMKKLEHILDRRIEGAKVKKVIYTVLNALVISASVFFFTMPVCVLYFGTITPLSIVGNIIFLPVFSPIIIMFGLYVMFYFVPMFSNILHFSAHILSLYAIKAAEKLGSIEEGVISFERCFLVPAFIASVVSVTLFCLSLVLKRKGLKIFSFVSAVCVVVLCIAGNSFSKRECVSINVYNVSDGLCVSVRHADKSALLFAQCSDYNAKFILNDESAADAVIVLNEEKANATLLRGLKNAKFYGSDLKLANHTVYPIENIIIKDVQISVKDDIIYIKAYDTLIAVTESTHKISADMVITNSAECAEENTGKTVIFSGESENRNFISTLSNSDITVAVKSKNRLSVRGENSWRNLMKRA